MEELKETCKKILLILDNEFPSQQDYEGVIRDIHNLVNKIYTLSLSGKTYNEKINLNSLIRQFVDETTHFSSPVIPELEKLDRLLS
ncbi:disulfide bond formation protein [Enterococcus plantarum]|uniref:disulfide bond formation protein n=1 Tax=Enterococcus plantarum TaxID=1077675 RepID=UPI001A8DA6CF|nr:disulfide bond formation protein [Enterococcus plantarum]MBO0468905.1 disulfide bond formation protein [Enterococcus plantarum]